MTKRLGQAAKVVDLRSARSRQRKVGASEIGVCRRRAAYSHHGTPFSNPENATGISAILGTWLHTGALSTMAREWGTLTELRVEDDMVRGHVDAIELPDDWRAAAGLPALPEGVAPEVVEVEDLKSKKNAQMVNHVRVRGPKRSELYQAHLYGGLLRRGMVGALNGARLKKSERALIAAARELGSGAVPVEVIRLRYFSRAGESHEDDQEYVYEQEFDPQIEREAWEWVRQVNESKDPAELPRDQRGPGLSVSCDHCPWLAECWGDAADRAPQSILIVTDADKAAALEEYHRQRAVEKEAAEAKDFHRATMDALDPAIYTDGAGKAYRLGWSGGKPRNPVPDVDAMIGLLEEAGVPVPMRDPGLSARTISVTPWEPPEDVCGKPVGDPTYFCPGGAVRYLQDRPRGGWSAYDGPADDLREVGTLAAGEFKKAHPTYTDPRPPCVLKKGHSTKPCRDESFVVELDASFDQDEADEPDVEDVGGAA